LFIKKITLRSYLGLADDKLARDEKEKITMDEENFAADKFVLICRK